ncbi:MAG: ribonuclease D [Acidimicrobiia bacterium]
MFETIESDEAFGSLLDRLAGEPRVALDTEFHRERTYFPRLALVQLAWSDGMAIIDPLSLDIAPLARLFGSGNLIVFHAAQQDLDVLTHAVGRVPARMFDTQIAAGFLGYSTPSLASLVNAEMKITLPKGDRLTDWLRRPLSEAQRSYAIADVEHLLRLHDQLGERLVARGRLEWAEQACEELRSKKTGPADPAEAWLRQKDLRGMKPRTRGILSAVAEWRERRAMASDIPPRQVLPDLALQGIAQRDPSTIGELSQARGVDDRHTRGSIGPEILAAVQRGRERRADLPNSDVEELDRNLRPAVTLVSAWISEVARTSEVDTALLATRNDIVTFLRHDPDARLAAGWRHDLVGSHLEDLLSGRRGLSFDGRGGLRLIDAPSDSAPNGPGPH